MSGDVLDALINHYGDVYLSLSFMNVENNAQILWHPPYRKLLLHYLKISDFSATYLHASRKDLCSCCMVNSCISKVQFKECWGPYVWSSFELILYSAFVDLCQEVTDSSYGWSSGTSMAAPHVAGVAAMYLGEFPEASPAEVKEAIISRATMDKIESRLLMPGTPNRLLYSNVFDA